MSMRLPVIGAAYLFKWYRSGGVPSAGTAAAAMAAHGSADECCDEEEHAREEREAGRLRVLDTLSRTLLADSFLRDVLLIAAGAVWVWHAEASFPGSSLAAGYSEPISRVGPLMWSGPLAFGSWLFVCACLSMVALLSLRSRVILHSDFD